MLERKSVFFSSTLYVFILFYFIDTSLFFCNSSHSETHCVDKTSVKLIEMHLSLSPKCPDLSTSATTSS